MGDHKSTVPENAKSVTTIDGYKDILTIHVASLTASKTIAELLGVAVPATAAGVTVITDGGVVNYNPLAAATADFALLPAVYTILGGKNVLDTVELFAASAATVELIVFGANVG